MFVKVQITQGAAYQNQPAPNLPESLLTLSSTTTQQQATILPLCLNSSRYTVQYIQLGLGDMA